MFIKSLKRIPLSLIKSISGIRGTIGGAVGENLTPIDIVSYCSAFGKWVLSQNKGNTIVIGRDARISGEWVSSLAVSTLRASGCNIIDVGLSTTPTVEMTVTKLQAAAGIIITASHNPVQWNAMKFLNHKGEFISALNGEELLQLAEHQSYNFVAADKCGTYFCYSNAIQEHIDSILGLPLVNAEAIRSKNFKVVVDAINSTGAISVVPLLEQLGCEVIVINGDLSGFFAHNPEPLLEHLKDICQQVTNQKANLGIVVDPDVDRLVFVCEDGELFGEEYTLVAVADYILSHQKGNTVSNLSSTKALKDVTEKHGGQYFASAVGEVKVVEKMKDVQAVIGGEGNGGVIYPPLHYGRDALVGIALFLSHLSNYGKPISFLRKKYPEYKMVKSKIQLDERTKIQDVFAYLSKKYERQPINTEDGLKIEFDSDWVHLRSSNTEPIVRIYAESHMENIAKNLVDKFLSDITDFHRSETLGSTE